MNTQEENKALLNGVAKLGECLVGLGCTFGSCAMWRFWEIPGWSAIVLGLFGLILLAHTFGIVDLIGDIING